MLLKLFLIKVNLTFHSARRADYGCILSAAVEFCGPLITKNTDK